MSKQQPTKEYLVTYEEVHEVSFTVKANSPEHAKQLVKDGKGQLMCDDGSSVNEIEDWTVEESD